MLGIVIQVLFIISLLVGISPVDREKIDILNCSNTNTIRYSCCFIVIISHIMFAETNLYLGYFHFVCVTMFFLLSGYGLTVSFLSDSQIFLKRQPYRILKLFLPYVVVLGTEKVCGFPIARGGGILDERFAAILPYILYSSILY